MKKNYKIKGAEKLARNRTRSLVFEDPGAAAAYAAQEAFAAGVSPSAVMYSSPDGPGNGDAAEAPAQTSVTVLVEGLDEIQHSEPPVEVVEPVEAPESVEEPVEAYEVADQPSEPLAAPLTPEEAMEELSVADDSDSAVDEDDDQDD